MNFWDGTWFLGHGETENGYGRVTFPAAMQLSSFDNA
jgi:hypothetical protein